MIRAEVCPGEDTLAAFAGGDLADDVLPRVLLHAAECNDCRVQLAAAVETDPELLNGRYKLLRKLGEGGMGVVYEADDLVLGERVALKLLRAELSREERAVEYLKSEVKLSRQIGHAHVCRVFDLGSQTSAGTTVFFLSMELLRGPCLRSLLASGPLEPQLALRLADQVLCGLQAAHAAGVLHRDLKPDNMLLRYPSPDEPHAVITDFGLARAFRTGQRHVTASRTLVGSAAYLAPEQVEEAPLTEATDVYSFGVVLFELLTGQQPFSGESPLGVALKRLHVQARRPSRVRPALGERYDAFVMRCLARDPNERFPSAADARAALQPLLEPLMTSARAPKTRSATLSAICTACAISLWVCAEHEIACSRELQPTAAAPARVEHAQKMSDVKPELPLSTLDESAPVVDQRYGQPLAAAAVALPPPPDVLGSDRLRSTPALRSATAVAQAGDAQGAAPAEGGAALRVARTGVAAEGGAALRGCAASAAESSAQVRACGRPVAGPSRAGQVAARRALLLTAAAAQDVLTADGFLDPFAD